MTVEVLVRYPVRGQYRSIAGDLCECNLIGPHDGRGFPIDVFLPGVVGPALRLTGCVVDSAGIFTMGEPSPWPAQTQQQNENPSTSRSRRRPNGR